MSTRTLLHRTNWERQLSEELGLPHEDVMALLQLSKHELGLQANQTSGRASKKQIFDKCRELSSEFVDVSSNTKIPLIQPQPQPLKESESERGEDDQVNTTIISSEASETKTSSSKKKKNKTNKNKKDTSSSDEDGSNHDNSDDDDNDVNLLLKEEVMTLREQVTTLQGKMDELLSINEALATKLDDVLSIRNE